MSSKDYFQLYRDKIVTAIDWFKQKGLDTTHSLDVAIFHVGSSVKLDKESLPDLFYVDFIKLTKYNKEDYPTIYAYKGEYPCDKLRDLNGNPMFYGRECLYMPMADRLTKGEQIVKQVDSVSISRLRSLYWTPAIKYSETEDYLPSTKSSKSIDSSVIEVLSFLAYLSRGAYSYGTEQSNTNGVIVIPVSILYSQIEDALKVGDELWA